MADYIDPNYFVSRLEELSTNPHAVMRYMLDGLEQSTNGMRRIPNPTNPVAFVLESAIALSTANINHSNSILRELFPSMAQTESDLYRHMSDVDYLNRFCTPSKGLFYIMLGVDEVKERAVEVPNSRIRKLVIPRHTEITISGYKFTMQYPIEIRIMAHGGFNIVYDVTRPSPLDVKATNNVTWRYVNYQGVDYIRLEVPIQQIEITTQYQKISPSSGFTHTYELNDQYHYCRAYMSEADGTWKEILTTHSAITYDVNKPTIVLQVNGRQLKVSIPPIYFATGLIDKEIRLDIYTSKGDVSLSLDSFMVNSFFAVWRDIEGSDSARYYTPITTFSDVAVFGVGVVSGGSNGLTFEELRERLINNNLRNIELPVSNQQLSAKLSDMGYKVVQAIDTITERVYQATRELPSPEDINPAQDTVDNPPTVTGIGSRMGTFIQSIEGLLDLDTVVNNNNRITILPNTLYRMDDGIVKLCESGTIDYVKSLSTEALVNNVNTNQYLYSPFHYVLDMNNHIFTVRPYYLDSPTIESRVFVAENDSTLLSVATNAASIARIETGYRLTVMTKSGEGYKALPESDLIAQLSFIPQGESSRAYIKGVLVGTDPESGERIWEFDIETNYDVDVKQNVDRLVLTSFKLIDADTPRYLFAGLETDFDLAYGVINYEVDNMEASNINQLLAGFFLTDPDIESYVGISHETFSLGLGKVLQGLWSKSRSVDSTIEYETYDADVPWLYADNVYELEPGTNAIKITIVNGVPTYNVLHRRGDPIMDEDGVAPLIKHLKGSVKFDDEGNPIIKNPRTLLRELSLLMLDGKYYFATDPVTTEYRDAIPSLLVNWLKNDIEPLGGKLHELTELLYYPIATIGNVEAMADGGVIATMPAEQFFQCQVYVNKTVYDNLKLRRSISNSITRTLAEFLQSSSMAMKDVIKTLAETLSNDIHGIDVKGLGGKENFNTVTLQDDSQRLVVGKMLAIAPDGSLRVQDAISINFSIHNPL